MRQIQSPQQNENILNKNEMLTTVYYVSAVVRLRYSNHCSRVGSRPGSGQGTNHTHYIILFIYLLYNEFSKLMHSSKISSVNFSKIHVEVGPSR